jgi:hypothetical protein
MALYDQIRPVKKLSPFRGQGETRDKTCGACVICALLAEEYAELQQSHTAALDLLRDLAETSPASLYKKLRAATEEARIDCQIARLELERHQPIHTKTSAVSG